MADLRGLHYILIGQPKPNGQPYTNTETDDWLGSEHAAKAARWLGYIPFDRIIDQAQRRTEMRRVGAAGGPETVCVRAVRVAEGGLLSPRRR